MVSRVGGHIPIPKGPYPAAAASPSLRETLGPSSPAAFNPFCTSNPSSRDGPRGGNGPLL